MRSKLYSPLIVIVCLYHTLTASHCVKEPVSPPNQMKSISELVEGNYSGAGLFMPSQVTLGPKTSSCSVPNWQAYSKAGAANANIISLSETSVKVTLGGGIYTTPFSEIFELQKNGDIISDSKGIIKYYVNSESVEFSFSIPAIAFGGACTPVNKYYYVSEGAITIPASPRFSYISIGAWEFDGNK